MSDVLALWRLALPALLDGLRTGLAVTGAGLLLGLPLGLGLALAAASRRPWLRLPALALAAVGRGAPVLILLEGAAVGLPATGLPLGPFAAAALALAWWTAAQTRGILLAALGAVPRGQSEAAAALGLDRVDTLRFVSLPQALRVAAPALLGLAVLLFQAASLGFAIGLPDLVGQALAWGAATSRVVPVLVLAALLYAAVCLPATAVVAALERRTGRPAA